MTNNNNQSSKLGMFLAPLTAPVVYVIVVFIFTPDLTPKKERTLEAALVALAVFIPCSYIMSFALGAPLVYLLKRFKKYSLLHFIVCSAPAGALAISILTIIAYLFGATVNLQSIEFVALLLATGAALGIVVAVSFYSLTGITKH